MIERKFVKEGVSRSNLNQFLENKLKRAGFIGVEIQKTPIATRVAIKVERPGLVIGRKGSSIKMLTEDIEKEFGFDNVQIKVEEVGIPELDAMVMARRISGSIERGINPRRVINFALEKIMQAGARGAEIIIAGKLIGKGGKAKKERISAGYLKKAGDMTKLVRVAQAQALKKAGTIGITVKIIPPDVVFPDKVDITKAVFTEEKKKEGGEASGNTEIRQDTGNEQRREAPAAPTAAQ